MADDGEIVINTKIDESGFDKGIQSLAQKTKEAGKSIENAAEKTRAVATQFYRHNGVPPAASFAFAKLESK